MPALRERMPTRESDVEPPHSKEKMPGFSPALHERGKELGVLWLGSG